MKRQGVVLYVDDSESMQWLVKRFFEKRYPAFEFVTAPTAERAWEVLEERRGSAAFPGAVVTDMHLSGFTDGLTLVEKIRSEFPMIRTIVVSTTLSQEDRERSFIAGAHAVVEKTLSIDQFIALLFDLIQGPTDIIPVRFRMA